MSESQYLTRGEIIDLIATELPYRSDRWLRNMLDSFGIKPDHYRSRNGEPGGPEAVYRLSQVLFLVKCLKPDVQPYELLEMRIMSEMESSNGLG